MAVTGRRKHNPLGLPARVYERHSAFHYVDTSGRWHRLGERWDRAARQEWARLSGGDPDRGSVAELLADFLKHRREMVAAGKLSARTLADNAIEVENLNMSFGHMKPDKVTSQHIAGYLQAALEACRGIRANREKACLSSAYSWGMRTWGIKFNPCLGVRRNTETPRERAPEGWELRKFGKQYCPRWLRAYVLLKHLTGLRQGDLLSLTRAAGAGPRLESREGKKRGRVRRYRWTWALRTVWKALIAEGDARVTSTNVAPSYLFVIGNGTPISRLGFKSAWQRSMKAWQKDGNERFTEHDIRARTAKDAGSIEEAKQVLGDSASVHVYRGRGAQKVNPLR